MYETPASDYYLCRTEVSPPMPWMRKYSNDGFYRYEQARIKDATVWMANFFFKKKTGETLDEVSMFVLPIKQVKYNWEAAIAEAKPNHYFCYLSSLCNDNQNVVVALFPLDVKTPEDFHLIRITKSRKDYIQNKSINVLAHVMLIEEWEDLPTESMYVDIPSDKKYVLEVLNQTLGEEANLARGFQSPLLSAPFASGSIGGISLSSVANNSSFAQQLTRTVQLLVPPEYREAMPPKRAYTGAPFEDVRGLVGWVAERPFSFNSRFVSVHEGFEQLDEELSRRTAYAGEYSVFSSIGMRQDEHTVEFLKNFLKTEVAIPHTIDSLQDGIDVHKIKKLAGEDVWAQVVKARQYMPTFESTEGYAERIQKLKADLDAKMSNIYRNDAERDVRVRMFLPKLQQNVHRLAQAVARSKNTSVLTEAEWKEARGLTMDNIEGFASHPYFARVFTPTTFKGKPNMQFVTVQSELLNNPGSNIEQIWANAKSTGYFKDIFELQGLLDWMNNVAGYVIVSSERKYYWV